MAIEVHALVKDSDDINSRVSDTKEQHMRADWIFAVAGPDVIACAAATRIERHDFNGSAYLKKIAIGLIFVPAVGGVVPNLV
jgi:hypothetical protein